MIKNFISKFKAINHTDRKSLMNNIIWLLMIGTVLIVVSNLISCNNSQTVKKAITEKTNDSLVNQEINYKLEQKLAKILAEIQGVGKVSVLISYESGPETVLAREERKAKSNTDEKDITGSQRRVQEDDNESKIVLSSQGGDGKPLVVRKIAPVIKGVVVAAQGGGEQKIKKDIIEAVVAVTGIPEYRVQVFKKQM